MSNAQTIERPGLALREGAPILSVEDLTITYRGARGQRPAVRDVSFELYPREAYGLVGESGCGKSTIALAIMRYLSSNGRVSGGRILFEGADLMRMGAAELRRTRGARMAMVYQDPGTALNPAITVGEQVAEVYAIHERRGHAHARAAAIEMLERVRLPGPAELYTRYPHQLSGGQQQRVVIAMALATNPALLIMDEPTTGLDATVEAAILDLVAEIRGASDAAILFISHNLAVVSRLCDRVGVLYAGELVEQGRTAAMFAAPHHPYTAGLLSCVPRFGARKGVDPLVPIPGRMPRLEADSMACVYATRCPVVRDVCRAKKPALDPTTDGRLARCFFWPDAAGLLPASIAEGTRPAALEAVVDETGPTILDVVDAQRTFGRAPHEVRAVDHVSFAVRRGQVFGLVGESGSGKSTLARLVAGLLPLSGGTLNLEGTDISRPVEQRDRASVKWVQMVFQSPEATLNPRQTVRQILRRTTRALTPRRGAALEQRVEMLGGLVGLDATILDSLPGALSGGQRQRVAIARAFAGDPDVVLCDEPVSALDVSVQAAILNLLAGLQGSQGVSYVFISHDLAVVRYLADALGVMYLGSLVEVGPVERVFAPPFHPYTETLFAAMPTLSVGVESGHGGGTLSPVRATGSMPSAAEIPSGCPFHTRCPRFLGEQCVQHEPPWQQTAEGHAYRCWIPPRELTLAQTQTAEGDITMKEGGSGVGGG